MGSQVSSGRARAGLAALVPLVVTALVAAPTVEDRLRTDPLMVPYYTGHLLPTPQRVTYRDEFIPLDRVALLVAPSVERPEPLVALLVDRITRYGGQAAQVAAPRADDTAVLSLGDPGVAPPDREQGYAIACTQAGGRPWVALAGHDRLGLVWAIASLNQLIGWREGHTVARAAEVVDWPSARHRGYINASTAHMFYAPAFLSRRTQDTTVPDTAFALSQERLFTVLCKFDMPVYQGLVLSGHGDHARPTEGWWRTPEQWRPELKMPGVIQQLGASLSPLGITWYGCVHPQTGAPEDKLCADEATVNALLYYARQMEAAGGHLDIQLDDVRFPLHPYDVAHLGTARAADTWIVTQLVARLKQDYPHARLLVCPPFYWGPTGRVNYGEGREDYLRTIGEQWPPEVDVWWTGAQVNGKALASQEHVAWITGLLKRKPFFWQNSAVTWNRAYWYHFGGEPINTLKVFSWDGFLDSLCWYGFNSDFPIRSIANAICADWQWNPAAYDAEASVKEAASKFVGPAAWEPLRRFSSELAYFDRFAGQKNYGWLTVGPFHNSLDELYAYAATNLDVLEEHLARVEAALTELRILNPVALAHWTGVERFYGLARGVVTHARTHKGLAPFREAVGQRAAATRAGDYVAADNDGFLAASAFKGGVLTHVADQPAVVLADKLTTQARHWCWQEDLPGAWELRLNARGGADARELTVTLNGRTLLRGPSPFTPDADTTLRLPLPADLLKVGDNLLKVSVTRAGAGRATVLALRYAVFKRQPARGG